MLRFFLTGSTALELKVTKPDTHGEWLTDKVWGDIVALSEMPQFGDKLLNDFKDNPAEWEQIYESSDPAAEAEASLYGAGGGTGQI